MTGNDDKELKTDERYRKDKENSNIKKKGMKSIIYKMLRARNQKMPMRCVHPSSFGLTMIW